GDVQQTFAQTLKDTIQNVNDNQIISDIKTEALSKGNIEDLHDVMIKAQKASITLETKVQIQRKVIDDYNQIMRKQVKTYVRKIEPLIEHRLKNSIFMLMF